MKYIGTFKDINNNQYTVNIITDNNTSTTTSVTLGTTPFVTEIETSEGHIFKPVKLSSATVRMVNSDYSFDLYSATAQENKVILYDNNNNIKWIGYTTPNLYSMGYENEVEEIEIECIDALSTLQYYNYTPLSGTKSIVSLLSIINKLMTKCNAYSYFYISNNLQLTSSSAECLSSKLYISEQNFFDEDNEPMKLDEVLVEICKFLGLTCIADGNSVYFLDYDAIKNGINTYYRFSVGSTTPTLVTLSQSKAIDGTDYVENGGQISLDNVYNKVVVKDSLYSFDSVIPSIWEEKDLVLYMTSDFNNNWSYYEVIDEDGEGGKHKCFFKYYSNPNYKSFYYTKNLNPVNTIYNITYPITQQYVGATIVRADFHQVDDYDDTINKVDFDDYLLLHVHDTNNTVVRGNIILDNWVDNNGVTTVEEDEGVPLFELEVNNANPSFVGGDNIYLLIQGKFLYMDRESDMYIMQGYGNKNDKFFSSELWIKAKLQWGNKYWNGTSWQSTECCFKLPFDNNGQEEHCINQTFQIKNTVTWQLGIEEDGYVIPMPSDNILTGKPTFTLFTPHRLNNHYRCDAVWLQDFDIKAVVASFDINQDKDSDTEYSNIIDEDYVNEMEDEEFKICTWDNKECNYSAVAYYNGQFSFIDTLYKKSTGQYLRAEKHLIYNLVTQYKTPSVILNLNLKNEIKLYATLTDKWLPNKVFIVDSITTDYEYNKATIKLIEKK